MSGSKGGRKTHLAGFTNAYGVVLLSAVVPVLLLLDLRLGEFAVLWGINLLRAGLDLPEVSLVAILDADKEGFLRSRTSLMQVAGRAARHASGKVLMFADRITDSMRHVIDTTAVRRRKQEEYNREHGITPQTIYKSSEEIREITSEADGLGKQEPQVKER